MQPGVVAVESVPGFTWIVALALIVAMFALFSLVAAWFRESWGRAVLSGLVLAATVGGGIAYAAPRAEEARKGYDYDATWARVEERYGVTLSDEDRAIVLPVSRGRYSGAILDQVELGSVLMPDGTVRHDLYLQWDGGRPPRVVLVTKPPGVSELLVTQGPWWDEVPVVVDGS